MCNIRALTFAVFSIGISSQAHAMQTKEMKAPLEAMIRSAHPGYNLMPPTEKEIYQDLEEFLSCFFNYCHSERLNPNSIVLETGETVLIIACKHDRQDLVEKLIAYGEVKANAQDKEGNTALHYACKKGNFRMVATLVSSKANPDIKNKVGISPLDVVKKEMHSLEDTEQYDEIYRLLVLAKL